MLSVYYAVNLLRTKHLRHCLVSSDSCCFSSIDTRESWWLFVRVWILDPGHYQSKTLVKENKEKPSLGFHLIFYKFLSQGKFMWKKLLLSVLLETIQEMDASKFSKKLHSLQGKRLLLLISLIIWSVVVVAAINLIILYNHRIQKYNLPKGLLPVVLAYKAFVLLWGWIAVYTNNRRHLFAHVYTTMPIIIFAIIMIGSSMHLLGYILAPLESLHLLLVYTVIGRLSLDQYSVPIDEESTSSSSVSLHIIHEKQFEGLRDSHQSSQDSRKW